MKRLIKILISPNSKAEEAKDVNATKSEGEQHLTVLSNTKRFIMKDEQLNKMIDNIVEHITHYMTLKDFHPDQATKEITISNDSGDKVKQIFPQRVHTVVTTLFCYLLILPLFKAQVENDYSWVGWTFKCYPNVQILERCHPPHINFGKNLLTAFVVDDIPSTSYPSNLTLQVS